MKDKSVILAVDDQPENTELLEAHLVPQGYEVVKAASGEEALKILSGNQIDLVLLDIMMPGLDGFQTLELIRERSNVPVIMLTAKSEKSTMRDTLELGADDYITKPFVSKELLARIKAKMRRVDLHSQKKY